jgi:group I intron endonuclease
MVAELAVSGIYIILSPSGRGYIGSAYDLLARKKRHFYELKNNRHHNPALQAAWLKYNGDLKFIQIEMCTVEKLIEREQWWIDNHRLICGRMYNASSIAGRPEHTPEVRAKISAAHKGRKLTDEHKAKLAITSAMYRHTPETLQKIMSHGVIGKAPTTEHRAKMNAANTGMADRARQMGLSHRGKKMSEETRAKMRISQAARYAANPYPESAKDKLRGVRGPRGPLTGEALANNRAGAKKRVQVAQAQRLREHMARMEWILWG